MEHHDNIEANHHNVLLAMDLATIRFINSVGFVTCDLSFYNPFLWLQHRYDNKGANYDNDLLGGI